MNGPMDQNGVRCVEVDVRRPWTRESTGETGVLAEERALTDEFLELFQLLDTSGDDLVEPAELEAGLKRVGYDITPDECKQILEQLDTTNDGAIDVNEFLAALVDWVGLVPKVESRLPRVA